MKNQHNTQILGDKSSFNKIPDLSEEVNREVAEKLRREEKKRKLKGKTTTPKTTEQPITTTPLEGFIYIPSINLNFSKQRTHLNKNWNQTHELLKQQNLAMPTLYQFKEFLKYLRDNPSEENTQIYNEITEVRSPWRSNWLNAKFEQKTDGLYMISKNILDNGNYKTINQKLDNYLEQGKRISLDSWLDSNESHGLPSTNILNGELYYWKPIFDSVARFSAGSDWANLDCGGGAQDSNASLGVFSVCEANASQQKNL